jgi:acetyltransferase-like isoleucine patch superfamily enzyme
MTNDSLMDNPFNPGYFESAELRSFGFRQVGENVRIARNCTIVGLENVSLGSNIRIDGNVVIAAHAGSLTIGNHIHIGTACFLACSGGIAMADFTGLSHGVCIYSATDDYSGAALTNPTIPAQYLNVKKARVSLERHAIVGSGSVILPGVCVGEGCSVGALSLVTKSLDPWGIYFGSPVKRLRARSRKLLELEAELLQQTAR